MADPPPLAPGTLLAGKFRIERLLGAGAMGAVYAIVHELTRHRRALKLLHPDARQIPDVVRRFLNEASAAGRAGDPHLVETFDAGTLPTGEPYVVMELLEGETLRAILERDRVLSPAIAAELVAQAAEGMEAAHRVKIVHRDLKPENLFVTSAEGRAFVKILDFGVSKFASLSGAQMSATRAGMLYGSPAYMSPEQITAQADVDARSDIFALGVVLFEALTGVRPFEAPTLEALTVRLLSGEATPIERLRPDLPSGLAAVVRSAIAALPEERLPTARALADALAPFRTALTGVASSQRTSAPPRRRARWGLVAAGIAIPCLAAGVIALGWGSRDQQATTPAPTASAARNGPSAALTEPPSMAATTEVSTPPAASSPPPPARSTPSPAAARKTASSPPSASTATSAAGPASNAQSIGISQDNPFRR
jgi:serine/threonine-protein kinase